METLPSLSSLILSLQTSSCNRFRDPPHHPHTAPPSSPPPHPSITALSHSLCWRFLLSSSPALPCFLRPLSWEQKSEVRAELGRPRADSTVDKTAPFFLSFSLFFSPPPPNAVSTSTIEIKCLQIHEISPRFCVGLQLPVEGPY